MPSQNRFVREKEGSLSRGWEAKLAPAVQTGPRNRHPAHAEAQTPLEAPGRQRVRRAGKASAGPNAAAPSHAGPGAVRPQAAGEGPLLPPPPGARRKSVRRQATRRQGDGEQKPPSALRSPHPHPVPRPGRPPRHTGRGAGPGTNSRARPSARRAAKGKAGPRGRCRLARCRHPPPASQPGTRAPRPLNGQPPHSHRSGAYPRSLPPSSSLT